MDKLFDRFLVLISKLSEGTQLWILFAVAFLILLFRFITSKTMQGILLNKIQNRVKHLKITDLKSNALFHKKERRGNDIDNIKFESKNKTHVFKLLLYAKLNTDTNLTSSYLSEKNILKLNVDDLCASMIAHSKHLTDIYETEFMRELQIEYGPKKSSALFNFIMDSSDGVRNKICINNTRLINQIDDYVRSSQIFDDNVERLEFFLSQLEYNLRSTILEAEQVFGGLNGEIDSIIKS